jgi:hypothetical protein
MYVVFSDVGPALAQAEPGRGGPRIGLVTARAATQILLFQWKLGHLPVAFKVQ